MNFVELHKLSNNFFNKTDTQPITLDVDLIAYCYPSDATFFIKDAAIPSSESPRFDGTATEIVLNLPGDSKTTVIVLESYKFITSLLRDV